MSWERGRLNRQSLETMSERELTRRAALDKWYRVYQQSMTAMEYHKENGDWDGYHAAKQQLIELSSEINRSR
jgi:hypothetical protein